MSVMYNQLPEGTLPFCLWWQTQLESHQGDTENYKSALISLHSLACLPQSCPAAIARWCIVSGRLSSWFSEAGVTMGWASWWVGRPGGAGVMVGRASRPTPLSDSHDRQLQAWCHKVTALLRCRDVERLRANLGAVTDGRPRPSHPSFYVPCYGSRVFYNKNSLDELFRRYKNVAIPCYGSRVFYLWILEEELDSKYPGSNPMLWESGFLRGSPLARTTGAI